MGFTEPSQKEKEAVSRSVRRLSKGARHSENEAEDDAPWWEGLEDARRCVDLLENADDMSGRNSQLMTAAQLEELWLGFLGHTIKWQERVSSGAQGQGGSK